MSEPFWSALGGAPPPPAVAYGTTLPASPTDGQEAVLVDSLTAPTYQWRFRYNAGSVSGFKWEFVGGTPIVAEVMADENCTTTTYADLTTAGPSLTVPRAGEYQIRAGGVYWITTAAATIVYVSPKLGAAATADADAATVNQGTGGTPAAALQRGLLRRTLAASDVVKVQYRNSAGGAVTHWSNRYLEIHPVRVS